MSPVQPGYINCLRLMFETCPAGGAGTRVSAELSLGLLLKPLKKVEQYERFPPGSLEEEQRLVLLDSCLTTVPTGAGPPLPPVRDGPDGAAAKDACANSELDRKSTRLNSSHANISYAVF